ncbi:CRISPR-associated helicase Cas3', partial [Roseiflexus sp.]
MHTPAYLAGLLAKSDGETLYEHTWHVIERLVDHIRLRPDLPARAGSPRLWHRLFWACLLHDFGKAATGFQRVLQGGKRWSHRHEVGSLAFLPWLFSDPAQEDYRWIVAAIVSHHKDANVIRDLYKPGGNAVHDLTADIAAAPLDALWHWLDREARDWFDHLGLKDYGVEFPHLLPRDQAVTLICNRGAALIEQALKTYRRFVDDLQCPDPVAGSTFHNLATVTLALRGLIVNADHSASAHTGSLPTLSGLAAHDVIARLGWSPTALYAHQTVSAQTSGHAILVAPTGSGKTEAALLWALGASPPSPDEPGRPPARIFYMLPFQASMNAMYVRLDSLFPGLVGLQHSRAIQALYRIFIEDGDEPRFAAQRAGAQKHRSTLNYYPIRVLSPYQILKACYRLKGYEAMLSDLWNGAFILDEVHAYEPKRLALILTLARYLQQHYGARFFVMSATLPDLVKDALSKALGVYQEIRATSETFQAFQRHQIYVLDGDMHESHHVQRIAADAASGKSVLVCCNTVIRAQHMWQRLAQALGPDAHVVLIHSRLTSRDRTIREQIVQRACGITADRRQPIVLV